MDNPINRSAFSFRITDTHISNLDYDRNQHRVAVQINSRTVGRYRDVEGNNLTEISVPRTDHVVFNNPNRRDVFEDVSRNALQTSINNGLVLSLPHLENSIIESNRRDINRHIQEANPPSETLTNIAHLLNLKMNQNTLSSLQNIIEGRDARPRLQLNSNPQEG